jgi:hypothetical protein
MFTKCYVYVLFNMYVNFHSCPQLNPDVNVFQRKFVNEVRRCEEMDRKLSKSTMTVPTPKTYLVIKCHPVISPYTCWSLAWHATNAK